MDVDHPLFLTRQNTDHIEAVEVVEVAVLPGAVHSVLVHGDLRAIEDGRFVHVVPGVQVLHRALVCGRAETASINSVGG